MKYSKLHPEMIITTKDMSVENMDGSKGIVIAGEEIVLIQAFPDYYVGIHIREDFCRKLYINVEECDSKSESQDGDSRNG